MRTVDHKLVDLDAYDPDPLAIAGIENWLRNCGRDRDESDAHKARYRLFVGNDPVVSWLAARIAKPIGIAHGELVCLEMAKGGRSKRWRAIWTAAPQDSEQLEDVRTKVRSKMSVAGSFGAVMTALLVFLLKNGVDRASTWSLLALAAFLGATLLYFVSLFFFDSLSMPSRFWGSRLSVNKKRWLHRLRYGWSGFQRPPSSTALVVQEAMVHTWIWVFLPATLLAGIGVLFLIASQLWPPESCSTPLRVDVPVAVALVAYLSGLAAYAACQRPSLGASD